MYGYSETFANLAKLNQDQRLVRVRSTIEPEPFAVRAFSGAEPVSRPFEFSVELISTDALLELKQTIGQPLRLSLQLPDGSDRHFHGYVKEFAKIGADGGMATYRAQIAPWFAFLEHTSNCRIFQDRTVVEIVEEVFGQYEQLAQADYALDLARYARMPYCVQYNESDFAFVSRLLEEAGIHYHFSHAEDGHVMCLRDDSTRSEPIAGRSPGVQFQSDQGVQNFHGLDTWSSRRRVSANLHSVKSFDFKSSPSRGSEALAGNRPLEVPLGLLPRLERYSYEGAARYLDAGAGEALATLRAQEQAWQTKVFEGAGSSRALMPGAYFVLENHYDHAESDEDDRRFFVIDVVHEARNNFKDDLSEVDGTVYRSRITCVRQKIPFRPLHATPQPRMPGPQTATVVGPPGEEIHEDRYGRVKVQFHWDRVGQFDGSSSCWVRVASPWAGAGLGGVSAPRIGNEVVVDFLDGDPDRPIIVGRVYNEDNPRPHGGEVSGIKSKTVKGEGYNALTMGDVAGNEAMDLHAQKDMSTTVLNDQTNAIKNNQSTDVTSNQTTTVGINQSVTVGADRSLTVKGNETHATTGTRTKTVDGAETSTVTGAVTETFKNGQTLTIPAAGYTETITGPFTTTLTGDYTSQRIGAWKESVSSTSERSVTGAVTETLGAGRTVVITGNDRREVSAVVEDLNGGDRTLSVGGKMEHGVASTLAISSGGDMTLGSGSLLELGVGQSGISIAGGEITIASGGSTIVINAAGVTVNGAKINLN
ncbi:type VI secretion system Vgr family protein [Lysobacter koreensis]|uniref:Type VI secretion system Vgr family protein n=1 Tax=Lysobacter koreensis TaxID=266122 RepID=A0ABW2YLR6_9GAMM